MEPMRRIIPVVDQQQGWIEEVASMDGREVISRRALANWSICALTPKRRAMSGCLTEINRIGRTSAWDAMAGKVMDLDARLMVHKPLPAQVVCGRHQ
jgi:hypothetical protein